MVIRYNRNQNIYPIKNAVSYKRKISHIKNIIRKNTKRLTPLNRKFLKSLGFKLLV